MTTKKRRHQYSHHGEVSLRLLLRIFLFVCLSCTVITLFTLSHHVPKTPTSPRLDGFLRSPAQSRAVDTSDARKRQGKSNFVTHTEKPKYTVGNTVTAQDLGLEDERFNSETSPLQQYDVRDKESILQLLLDAGIEYLDAPTLQQLPTLSHLHEIYGKDPVVLGLEHCPNFQSTVPQNRAALGPAGMFNSGTNILYSLLEGNCVLPENDLGIYWQVPWGKHMLANRKDENTVKNRETVDKDHVLPVVVVRDPYTWMRSMCKHPYAVMWHHSKEHCPNLVPNSHDYKLYKFPGANIPVRIKQWGKPAPVWKSLAHLWSDWYQQYYDFNNNPRLMVRLEDLIFNPKTVIRKVCDCVGGVSLEPDQFNMMVESAKFGKGHGDKTSLVGVMAQHSKERIEGHYSRNDLHLAHDALLPELMEAFHYKRPLEKD